jgi:hypothetical protein
MSGNNILLYLEHPEYMRLSEVVHALNQLCKRDPQNKYDLINHDWVKGTIQHLNKNHMYMVEDDVFRTVVQYYRLGV